MDDSNTATQQPVCKPFSLADVISSLSLGWQTFRQIPQASMAYSSIFTIIGLLLLSVIGVYGFSPMAIPIAGGFMLIGPVILSVFFKLSDLNKSQQNDQQTVRLRDALKATQRTSSSLWVIALFCSFLFLIWISDAATLYAFMIGSEHMPYQLPWVSRIPDNVLLFEAFGSLMGAVIAFTIMAISAFSVPLLYQDRAKLIPAVTLSVKAIFSNFISSIIWGCLLASLTLLSILLLPLLIVVLPVLAYTSYELYKKVFPIISS